MEAEKILNCNEITRVLCDRDGLTPQEASDLFDEACEDFYERLGNGEDCQDICEEWFGLEPDYLFYMFPV